MNIEGMTVRQINAIVAASPDLAEATDAMIDAFAETLRQTVKAELVARGKHLEAQRKGVSDVLEIEFKASR